MFIKFSTNTIIHISYILLLLLNKSNVVCSNSAPTTATSTNNNNVPLDYDLNDDGRLSISVGISWPKVITMFNDEEFDVRAHLSWMQIDPPNTSSSNILRWVTTFDGNDVGSGEISLLSSLDLPKIIDVGKATAYSSGTHKIEVTLYLDDNITKIKRQYESIPAGVSIVPIIVVMLLSVIKHSPTFAMCTGIIIGSCIITGGVYEGVRYAISNVIVKVLTNPKNISVFVFFSTFSGLISLMEKSGGIDGFAKVLSRYVKNSKGGQFVVFVSGVCFFFDSYSSILTVGGLCYPITDRLFISREKLAFLVDSTCSPVISIMPISKWISFVANLLQEELDSMKKLKEDGDDIPDGLPTSGTEVFLATIKYRYYPIFMLFFIPCIIAFDRDFGPMLIAERKVFIYGRTDGGDGREERSKNEVSNKPKPDTPKLWYNMAIPIILLITFLLLGTIVVSNEVGVEQTIREKINNSDSNKVILIGTVSTTICVIPLYLFQFVKDGVLYLPGPSALRLFWIKYRYPPTTIEDANEYPRQLLTMFEFKNTFVNGIIRVQSFFAVLTLAWGIALITTQIGTDRFFATKIISSFHINSLPTFAYVTSCLMSLATGTSFGTMTIMITLITKPSWTLSKGDLDSFYQVIGAVLSGSIFGDHVSPISDTTLLSSYACHCGHMQHVMTQAPYALVPGLLAILCGTLPVGYKLYSNVVGFILGLICTALIILLLGKKLVARDGSYDILTEISMLFVNRPDLMVLKRDTAMVDSSY